MFGVGPAYLFILKHRLPVGMMRGGWQPWASSMATNLAICLIVGVLVVLFFFITVDGVAKTNGHVCCGDPGSKEDAIEAAVKEVPFRADEAPVKRALEQGPPGDQPFATLVSKYFKKKHFVDLTMRVAPGKTVDDVIMDESKAYLHSYINVCSELFAEIGAGQEVGRWFFRAGGAAGTIAKTMSAYDKQVSDAIYGTSQRYVSSGRLLAMLDHEYDLLLERLDLASPGVLRKSKLEMSQSPQLGDEDSHHRPCPLPSLSGMVLAHGLHPTITFVFDMDLAWDGACSWPSSKHCFRIRYGSPGQA